MFDDIALNPFSDDNYSPPVFLSNQLIDGDGSKNVLPTVGDQLQDNSDGPFNGSNNIAKLMGSIGSTATAAGTAIGTAQNQLAHAGDNFNNARSAAASGNSLSTFWQYASSTDKAVILIGLATIVIMLVEHK